MTSSLEADSYLPGHGDDTFGVLTYDLELDYRVATNHLDGRARLELVANRSLDRFQLDLCGLEVRKVNVEGARLDRYSLRSGRLQLRLAAPVEAGARLTVSIRYAGQPGPLRSTWGDVGWEELTDGVIVAGQPGGAPSWFPCNDRPDNKARYRISISTDSAYTVVANGRLTDRRTSASSTRWTFEQDEPMASYLATVQVGRYESLPTVDRPVPQQVFAPASLRAAAEHDFGRQAEMVSYFCDTFGPYPFASYTAVVTADSLEIPLEAQGISVFGANHVDGRRGSERLVAHELAHQWFGNSLTLTHWRDIWLHEGFACYAEWLWAEQVAEGTADQLARRHHRALTHQSQDLIVADPGADLMFDDRLYKRGALALHALRLTIGDDDFFSLLQSWVERHRHGSVTTAMFLDHIEEACGATAPVQVVQSWIDEPKLPALPRRV